MLMMGLRLAEGISHERYAQLSGQELPREVLADLIDTGHLELFGDRITVTKQGLIVLNAILDRLLNA